MSESDNKYVLQTAGFDVRFPNTNQTKHCWQAFVDYHKCIKAKGDDFAPCKAFHRTYKSICPNPWTDKWNEQIDEGNFPSNINP
ncbi:hypothetical protein E3P99_03533 [Wallemia hederae]|uniref:Cytochrome c oxidase subunit n=1 Tax=Wallemia hederae TaxID=1540922 RepID=A0A4T0FG77_9BASI|nr:hypothetical protein E3P99_03533 [Wallemia hederae]